jgi:hypothetical protein
MKNEFIPYEQALELKELGFKEDCLASYYHAGKRLGIGEYINHGNYTILAPLKQQVFRWFREKHKLHCWVKSKTIYNGKTIYIGNGRTLPDTLSNGFVVDNVTYAPKETYEEEELACLKKLIEIVKTKEK